MNLEFILIAIVVIILIFVIWYISTSNKLNRTVVKIDESLSGIDIALTKRYDVLTKMIEVVKSYALPCLSLRLRSTFPSMVQAYNLRKIITSE